MADVFFATVTATFDTLAGGYYQRLFDFSNGPGIDSIWLGNVAFSSTIAFEVEQNGTRYRLEVPNAITQGVETTWTVTVDDTGTLSILRDGTLIGSQNFGLAAVPNDVIRTTNLIGSSPHAVDDPLIGSVRSIDVETTLTHGFDLVLTDTVNQIETYDGSDRSESLDASGTTGATSVSGDGGADTITGGSGADTLRGDGWSDTILGGAGDDLILGDGPTTVDAIVVAHEDFTGGAGGWTNTTTANGGPFGDFLGRFEGTDGVSSGGPLTERSFALADGYTAVIVEFDLLIIDSWDAATTFSAGPDGDAFQLYVNGQQVANEQFLWNDPGFDADRSGTLTLAGVTYTFRFVQVQNGDLGFSGIFTDQVWRVRLEVETYTADQITLGFGSTTDQGLDDESFGIDNLTIVSTNDSAINIADAAGDDLLLGGAGGDTIDGGAGNDTLIGGDGNDLFIGSAGADSIDGGDTWWDIVDYSGSDAAVTITLADTLAERGGHAEGDTLTGIEQVLGSNFDDVFIAAASGTSFTGLGGNDTFFDGAGDDRFWGNDGNDVIHLSGGADLLEGQADADTFIITDGFGNATLTGGDEISTGINLDTIDLSALTHAVTITFTGNGAGTITAPLSGSTMTFSGIERLILTESADGVDASADSAGITIVQGGGNDTLVAGAGNDTIAGGTGDDSLRGGAGNDIFTYAVGDGLDTIADFNTGNTGTLDDGIATNNDAIDLSGFYDTIAELQGDHADDGILNQSNSGTTVWGRTVDYTDNTRFDTDGIAGNEGLVFLGASPDGTSFTQENTGVICFTQGTMILTESGARKIESLRPGDRIVTRDNGVQTLQWVAQRQIDAAELRANDRLRPVMIRPGLIRADAPLLVSPQHGVLLRPDGGDETLVRAIHLARRPGGQARVANGIRAVTYIHLMFETHQIVFANGAPSESFYPGPMALAALSDPARAELRLVFPDLFTGASQNAFGPRARDVARMCDLPETLHDLRAA